LDDGWEVSEMAGSRRRTDDEGLILEVFDERGNVLAGGREVISEKTSIRDVVVKLMVEVSEVSRNDCSPEL
jgi:hypothetical protein